MTTSIVSTAEYEAGRAGTAGGAVGAGAGAGVVVSVTAERRPGRPRSATADQAILDAALELFVEAGLEGLAVEQVAARAGVGKATIYRRYPGKIDLVIAAARCLTSAVAPVPDTGTADGDLRAIAGVSCTSSPRRWRVRRWHRSLPRCSATTTCVARTPSS